MANSREAAIPIDKVLLDALQSAVEAELAPQLEATYLELMERLSKEGKRFDRMDLPLAMEAWRIRLTEGSPCLHFSPENEGLTYAPASCPVTRALTAGTDLHGPEHPRRHGARTATCPSDAMKDVLADSIARARAWDEPTAGATPLKTTAGLTWSHALKVDRTLDTAEAKLEAGAPNTAIELLATVEEVALDDLQRARLERLRARTAFARKRGSDAVPLLLDAAKRLEALDTGLARETYLEAFQAALAAGRLNHACGVREVTMAARNAPPSHQPPTAKELLLEGLVTRFGNGYALGVPRLRRALEASWHEAASIDEVLFWWSIAADMWDDAAMHALGTRALRLARQEGALGFLPMALPYRGAAEGYGGRFAAAWALLEEAEAITEATINAPFRQGRLLLSAWDGQEAETLELLRATVREANSTGSGGTIGTAEYAMAVLYNGLGRYPDAVEAAQRACEHEDLSAFNSALVELVEAAARSNRTDLGTAAMTRLAERTTAAGTNWALGLKARSQALLSAGRVAEALFVEAIEHLARTRVSFELGRSHLLYGEWLRRERRRRDARQQLRIAHEMLSRNGAQPFAERARRELLATGEAVRRRSPDTMKDLTPQERQIGELAAGGHTNLEIGDRLFISPRTVEWHLRNLFTKLGLQSRRELRKVLAG